MGSFNIDCALSSLPITPNVPTRAFIVAKVDGYTTYPAMYATANWMPITAGLLGEYDDSGTIQKCKPSALFSEIVRRLFPEFEGNLEELIYENRYGNDDALNYSITSHGREIELELDVAFVREDVYQAMKAMDYTDCSSNPSARTDFTIKETQLKEEFDVIRAALDSVKKENEIFEKTLGQSYPIDIYRLKGDIHSGLNEKFDGSAYLSSLFYDREGDLSGFVYQKFRDILFDRLKNEADIEAETIAMVAELAEFLHLDGVIRDLGKMWAPSTQLISQQTPFMLQHAFAEVVSDICMKEITKRMNEENDPEHYKDWKAQQAVKNSQLKPKV